MERFTEDDVAETQPDPQIELWKIQGEMRLEAAALTRHISMGAYLNEYQVGLIRKWLNGKIGPEATQKLIEEWIMKNLSLFKPE